MDSHEHAASRDFQDAATPAGRVLTPDELVAHHYDYTLSLAFRFCLKLPPDVDADAIRGASLEALVHASRSYDASRGWAFATWARVRIAGAMVDELRRLDPNAREAHKKGTALPRPLSLQQSVDAGESDPTTLGDTLRAADDVEHQAQGRLELRALVHGIRALSDINRDVVVRWLSGEPLRAIADDFGVTEARISQRLTQSRQALAAALA